ncbi:MAG: DUF1501 domain-containing protein [Planctomycetota bacterium]
MSRRQILSRFGQGLGTIALASLLNRESANAAEASRFQRQPHLPAGTHFAPKAKRVIFLFQSGAPSQIESFDYKPTLNEMHGRELPDSVRRGQRLTGMSGNQSSLPLVGSPFKFDQHGDSGAWISDRLPHTASVADEICFVKSMYTEAINHGPGVTFMQTGSQFPGRPSVGAWLSYGLGSESENLPGFVVLVTNGQGGQPLVSRFWGSGFLPGKHDGVRLRSDADAVLYLQNPNGIDSIGRRNALDRIQELHAMQLEQTSDPALETRIAQFEMAYRMQSSIPELTDFSQESDATLEMYGKDAKTPGTYAANCLLARRMAERGVRFIQLYHSGWDHHGNLPSAFRRKTQQTDQASAALVKDLKQRGLLEDTLVVWGGEFGRTNYCQGKMTNGNFGRDHHPRCFSIWMAGGGVKPGYSHGETDEFSYNIAEGGVHIHDLHATILHLLGIDHERLTFKYQGRHFRLTDVHGHVVKPILA